MICEFIRIAAYKSRCTGDKALSRTVRKLFARTQLHRAWLQGWTGSFLLPVLERMYVGE